MISMEVFSLQQPMIELDIVDIVMMNENHIPGSFECLGPRIERAHLVIPSRKENPSSKA